VVEEARDEFPGHQIDSIVSIGTGETEITRLSPGIVSLFWHSVDTLTTTEAADEDFLNSRDYEALSSSYFRSQEEEPKIGIIDLAAADQMDEIERLAQEYLNTPEAKQMIWKCAARMTISERF
jgi:hypothetical protein